MDCTKTPAGADLTTPLAGPMAEPSSVFGSDRGGLEPDVPPEANGMSDTPECSPCDSENNFGEGITERETFRPERPVDPNGPTVAEVGAHFAAAIVDNAAEALRAAARLGPKRVLSLLV